MEKKNCINCKHCQDAVCEPSRMANCIIGNRSEWNISDKYFDELLDYKVYYDALLDCCNGIIDSVDAGKVPQRGIMGLKILLNR